MDNALKSLETENDDIIQLFIQLFKISLDVDKENILYHLKKAGDYYNTQSEPGNPEVPVNCYNSTEIQSDNSKKPS